jgi:uncharacterized protein YbjQ (UPF0145 family)
MIVTALESVAGLTVGEPLGLVRGRAICQPRDNAPVVSGRNRKLRGTVGLEQVLDVAREQAMEALRRNAKLMEADAVIGLRNEIVEQSSGALMVFVWGTAITAGHSHDASDQADDSVMAIGQVEPVGTVMPSGMGVGLSH